MSISVALFRTLLSLLLCSIVEVTSRGGGAVEGNSSVAYNFIRASGAVAAGRAGRRLFGGAPAQLDELPSVCALTNSRRHVTCSGAVLHSHWALTAAHCLSPRVALVRYGTDLVSSTGEDAQVHSQYRHPKYRVVEAWLGGGWDVVGLHHDVGLVRTWQSMAQGATPLLYSLELYEPEQLYDSEIRVLGFGRTESGEPGERLMGAALLLARCGRPGWRYCACGHAADRTARAVCAGDSGGPVLYRGALVGVTSMGPVECAPLPGATALSVFTTTRRYSALIVNTVLGARAPRMSRVYPAAGTRARIPLQYTIIAAFVILKI